jgi:hypothetical protein
MDENFNGFLFGYENLNVGNETNYTISGLNQNTDYYYRLRALNVHDTGAYSNTVHVQTLLGTGTTLMAEATNRVTFFPNPFTDELTIVSDFSESTLVSIQLFDAMGTKVAELHNGQLPSGQQQFSWDAGELQKGMYFCRVQAGNEMKMLKIIKH